VAGVDLVELFAVEGVAEFFEAVGERAAAGVFARTSGVAGSDEAGVMIS